MYGKIAVHLFQVKVLDVERPDVTTENTKTPPGCLHCTSVRNRELGVLLNYQLRVFKGKEQFFCDLISLPCRFLPCMFIRMYVRRGPKEIQANRFIPEVLEL